MMETDLYKLSDEYDIDFTEFCYTESNHIDHNNPYKYQLTSNTKIIKYEYLYYDNSTILRKIIKYNDGILNDYLYPSIICYSETGKLTSELYYVNGILHREYDKPAIIHYAPTGQIICEQWFYKGNFHRELDKPALIKYLNGVIVYQTWYIHGIKHRDYKPATIIYNNEGDMSMTYWHNNKHLILKRSENEIVNTKHNSTEGLYRQDYLYKNGSVKITRLYKNGLIHNDNYNDGAIKYYYERTGILKKEIFMQNGIRYKSDIYYKSNGEKT